MPAVIRVPFEFEQGAVAALLNTALGGASHYWIVEYDESHAPLAGGTIFITVDLSEFGSDPSKHPPGKRSATGDYPLDRAGIERGLQLFMSETPLQFATWISEQDDIWTADVFLQLCLFGRVVFG